MGLLVHDAIIALEMMVVKMEEGCDRVKAASFSYSSTAVPRLTGALMKMQPSKHEGVASWRRKRKKRVCALSVHRAPWKPHFPAPIEIGTRAACV